MFFLKGFFFIENVGVFSKKGHLEYPKVHFITKLYSS